VEGSSKLGVQPPRIDEPPTAVLQVTTRNRQQVLSRRTERLPVLKAFLPDHGECDCLFAASKFSHTFTYILTYLLTYHHYHRLHFNCRFSRKLGIVGSPSVFRSTFLSRPKKVSLKCPSSIRTYLLIYVRPPTKFLRFQ